MKSPTRARLSLRRASDFRFRPTPHMEYVRRDDREPLAERDEARERQRIDSKEG